MKDAALHLEVNFPAAGATVTTATLDLNVDVSGFSDQWRLGRLKLTVPALPNNSDNTKTILVDLQDSGDGGATFANSQPLIEATIPGVTTSGSAATVIDMPLPPGLRGPIRAQHHRACRCEGDNTAALLQADWANE